MSNFVLLGVCFLAGWILRQSRRLPRETPAVLNGFIFHLSLPALVFIQFHSVTLNLQAFEVASIAWLLFGLSAFFFVALSRVWKWDKKTLGALILTAGLGNTSFVGYPILEALYGRDSLKTAVLVDQMGSFLILSSLGIGVASFFSEKNFSFRQMGRRIFTFPPVHALILACVLSSVPIPLFLEEFFNRLGSTLTPLALVSTGFQLKLDLKTLRRNSFQLTLGLLFKLIMAPAILAFIYIYCFHLPSESARIAILESAMAPMITAAVVVSEYELNSELANLMVGLGIPISFLTVLLWAKVWSV